MVRKTRRYTQLIAVDLIPFMEELRQNPPPIKGFSISRMEYLITLILTHKQKNHLGAWSVLYMAYLRNVVPQADEYIKLLKERGIIQWRNHSVGRNSTLYRLTDEGRTEIRTIKDQQLIRRIEEAHFNICKRNSRKYPQLNKYIHLVGLDVIGALRTVELTYQEGLLTDPATAESRRTYSLGEIGRIQAGHIYISCNDTNGRLDSNYTRLPSELVLHLVIDGKSLSEIDIRNSQPFFAAAMMNPTPEVERLMERYLGLKLTGSVKSMHISECEDVRLYTTLVLTGNLYEFMMEKVRKAGVLFKDRSDLKERLFVVFFGRKGSWRYDKIARVFQQEFPNVLVFFEKIKQEDHRKLSVFLQRIESCTMLEKVAPAILNELPGLPFITKHDSILPSADGLYAVGEIMIRVITEVTGMKPSISIKCPISEEKVRA